MNRTHPFRPIRRLASILAALAAALLAVTAAAPAAFAVQIPPGAAAGPCHHPRCAPSPPAACPPGRSPSSPWLPRPSPPPSRYSWTGPAPPAATRPHPAPNPRRHPSARPRKPTQATRPGAAIPRHPPGPEPAPCTRPGHLSPSRTLIPACTPRPGCLATPDEILRPGKHSSAGYRPEQADLRVTRRCRPQGYKPYIVGDLCVPDTKDKAELPIITAVSDIQANA